MILRQIITISQEVMGRRLEAQIGEDSCEINLQSPNIIIEQYFSNMLSTPTRLLPYKNPRTLEKRRSHSLNTQLTTIDHSFSSSKKSSQHRKTIPRLDIQNLFQQRMKLIRSNSPQSQLSVSNIAKTQGYRFQKEEQEQYLQQKLEEMKEDKFKYLIFKNKIKRKFHKANVTHGEVRIKDVDRQNIYRGTQADTVPVNPSYSKSSTTFWSKSRKVVCDEQCPELKSFRTIDKKSQDADVDYLRYVSDQLHRKTFRKTIRAKPIGSTHLQTNKEQIVRLVTQGRRENQLLFEYIQQILHQN